MDADIRKIANGSREWIERKRRHFKTTNEWWTGSRSHEDFLFESSFVAVFIVVFLLCVDALVVVVVATAASTATTAAAAGAAVTVVK